MLRTRLKNDNSTLAFVLLELSHLPVFDFEFMSALTPIPFGLFQFYLVEM